MTKVTIITDADACIPITLCRKFGILTAPLDPPLLINAEPAASLRRDQAPLKHDTAVATALHASVTSTIIVYDLCINTIVSFVYIINSFSLSVRSWLKIIIVFYFIRSILTAKK